MPVVYRTKNRSLVVALALVAACSRAQPEASAPPPIVHDLTAQLSHEPNGVAFDFQRPDAQVDSDGWSMPQVLPELGAAAWPAARRATLRFELAEPHDSQLLVRAKWVGPAGRRTPRLSVRINRHPLAAWSLDDGVHDYGVPVPAGLLRSGLNVLDFSTIPKGSDARRRGAAVARIRLAPSSTTTSATTAAPEFFVRGGAQAHFEIDTAAGEVPQVTISRDGAPDVTSAGIPGAGDGTRRYALPGDEAVPLRLRLGGVGADTVRRPRLVAATTAAGGRARATPAEPWNVVVYVVDTLRADHLGCYGYGWPTSPHIDAFAERAQIFVDATAQSSWTRPATASILTGMTPPRHGARTLRQSISATTVTLAERLAAAGYATAGFVTNFNVAPQWGFARGFDAYVYLAEDESDAEVHVSAARLHQQVSTWLDGRSGDRPFFLYVHASDPHAPYTSAAADAGRFGYDGAPQTLRDGARRLRGLQRNRRPVGDDYVRMLVAGYDAEIAAVDRHFGAFVEELARRGLAERTVVVLTSDHGEEFYEHRGFEHGKTLYAEQLAIPLILSAPSLPAARVRGIARQIDIVPTILDLVGIAVPRDLEGRSLLSASGAATGESLSETRLGRRRVHAVTTTAGKVIRHVDRDGTRLEVFRRDDRGDRDDVADAMPVFAGYGRQRLRDWLSGSAAREGAVTTTTAFDAATAERLRALGYEP